MPPAGAFALTYCSASGGRSLKEKDYGNSDSVAAGEFWLFSLRWQPAPSGRAVCGRSGVRAGCSDSAWRTWGEEDASAVHPSDSLGAALEAERQHSAVSGGRQAVARRLQCTVSRLVVHRGISWPACAPRRLAPCAATRRHHGPPARPTGWAAGTRCGALASGPARSAAGRVASSVLPCAAL